MVVLEPLILKGLSRLRTVTQIRILLFLLENKTSFLDKICSEFKISEKKVEDICKVLCEKGLIRRFSTKEGNQISYIVSSESDVIEKCCDCLNGFKESQYGVNILTCKNDSCLWNYFRCLRNMKKLIKVHSVGKDYEKLKGNIKERDRTTDEWKEKDFVRFFNSRFAIKNSQVPDLHVIKNKIRLCMTIFRKRCKEEFWKRVLKSFIIEMVDKCAGYGVLKSIVSEEEVIRFLKIKKVKFKETEYCPRKNIYCSHWLGDTCSLEKNEILCSSEIVEHMKEKYN